MIIWPNTGSVPDVSVTTVTTENARKFTGKFQKFAALDLGKAAGRSGEKIRQNSASARKYDTTSATAASTAGGSPAAVLHSAQIQADMTAGFPDNPAGQQNITAYTAAAQSMNLRSTPCHARTPPPATASMIMKPIQPR